VQRQRRMLDILLGGMEATRRRLVQVDEQLDALARGRGTVDAAALQAALEELLQMLKEKIDDTNGLRLNETVGERASRWREIAKLRASLGMSPQAARLQASSLKSMNHNHNTSMLHKILCALLQCHAVRMSWIPKPPPHARVVMEPGETCEACGTIH
jgi:hypothetical protein